MKKVFLAEKYLGMETREINLLDEYTHIRGYHGCRPEKLEEYYTKGVIVLNQDELLHKTLYLLGDSYLSKERIKETFYEKYRQCEHNGIWFTLSEIELIENAPHYMIYGSEFIHSVASDLFSRQLLKEKGIPTIFHLDIPLNEINSLWLESLLKNIKAKNLGGGFKTDFGISPSNIVGISHPSKLIDYHEGGIVYSYDKI